ncbi:hypothetical protein HaLaN_09481 [Haematococcus lacustris]|uniref:Uncharacterized protein n=1 Tax=Haematococcus lacustris TaxID=44745 RepID=A0A699YTM3_HAELA|nr:hypothetical protein HaLaN_09481 [Haematococcus lacustris]
MQRLSKDAQWHSVTADSIKKLRSPHFGLLLGAGNCCQRRVLVGCSRPCFRTGVARCRTITQVHKMGVGLAIRQLVMATHPCPCHHQIFNLTPCTPCHEPVMTNADDRPGPIQCKIQRYRLYRCMSDCSFSVM